MNEPSERLRQHPEQRFHARELQFDIEGVAAKLLGEPLASNRRHRQETLYHQGSLTIALFLFERGGSLPAHSAKGIVTVHVLQGRLRMTTAEQVHDLPGGSMLVMAAGVKHDLEAIEATRMLLTVSLEHSVEAREQDPAKV